MADNTFVNIGGHKVSAGKKYSTSEVKTGDVWIDGKPIYRKVVQFTLISGIGWTYYNHNISNIDEIILLTGLYKTSAPTWVCIGGSIRASNVGTWLVGDKTRIGIYSDTSEGQNRPATVTIEYTKTTD